MPSSQKPDDDIAYARLKVAADAAARKQGLVDMSVPDVKRMIEVVEAFLRGRKRICYGGTAVNNLLPVSARFYDPESDIPDYDFLSPSSEVLKDGTDLIRVFKNMLDYKSVELRQGAHLGTYKLFVDYRGIADITATEPRFYDALMQDAIEVDGIMYASPNYLRMSMYLELSRPDGDVSRWTKVYKRLQLLNQYRPMELAPSTCGAPSTCASTTTDTVGTSATNRKIHSLILPHIMRNGYVMLGAHTLMFYKQWNTPGAKVLDALRHAPPAYILLSEDYGATAAEMATLLRSEFGAKAVKLVSHPRLGEIVPPHREITVFGERTLFIYQTIACHSYYPLEIAKGKVLRIATMDTMLSLYLAFVMSDRTYYQRNSLLCMAQYMIDRVAQLRSMSRPPFPPISIDCLGHQHTLRDIKREQEERYKKLTKDERALVAIRTAKTKYKGIVKLKGSMQDFFSETGEGLIAKVLEPRLAKKFIEARRKVHAKEAAKVARGKTRKATKPIKAKSSKKTKNP